MGMVELRQLKPVTLLNVKVLDFLACPNCGYPLPGQAGKCCNGTCRVALHRWKKAQACDLQEAYNAREVKAQQLADAKARRPVKREGGRSLKPLRSYNTEYDNGGTLRTVNRACLDNA
jgi:hypothetical protein